MTFIRIKKIKGNEYAYLVENEWHRKGSRQKVKGYVGRAYRFQISSDIGFGEFITEDLHEFINKSDYKKIIKSLLDWEFFRRGISQKEFLIDLNNLKVSRKNKEVALNINDAFLCSVTIKNLLEFKPVGDEHDGYLLARAFVEAGIKIPNEVFIGLFDKIQSQSKI